MDRNELFDLALQKYGTRHQLGKLAEECSEFLEAWFHYLDGRDSKEHLAEELAGIVVTAWQARLIIGTEIVDDAVDAQLEKLEQYVLHDGQPKQKSTPGSQGGPMFVRAKHLAARYGVSVGTIWKWVREGILPQPERIGKRCCMWKVTDVDNIVNAATGNKS